MKRMNKKGFTLAELLIVVAIIAVLTAIAVPLFVGAINDAKKNVKNANISAVREAAVVEILQNQADYLKADYDENEKKATDSEKPDYKPEYVWIVKAKVTADGDIKDMVIGAKSTAAASGNYLAVTADATASCNEKDGEYYVAIWLTELAVNA